MAENEDELVTQLKRVQSDIGYRRWARRKAKLVMALIVFDLVASVAMFVAVFGVHSVQTEACNRDNRLRAAYVAQWQPVLDIAPLPLASDATDSQRAVFAAQLQTRQRFQEALTNGFQEHSC